MGLDRPLGVQYVAWLVAFVRGDWGYSYADGRPVLDRMLERVPATLQLVGIVDARRGRRIAGRRHRRRRATRRRPRRERRRGRRALDSGVLVRARAAARVQQRVRLAAVVGTRVVRAAADFGDRLAHLVLPVDGARASRTRRAGRATCAARCDCALAQPFANAARARGVTERRIVLRHALRHALLPFATVVLLDASIMASGAVVTESVFAWPGIGSLFTEALAKRDYTVLMAFLMCASVAVVMLSFVADVAVHALDPRTRDER